MANNDIERSIVLQGRVFVQGNIKAVTGLHIGGAAGALEIGGVDSPVIRNPLNNQPYIPGSSLRGKMRSLTERLHGSVQNMRIGKGVFVHVCRQEKRSDEEYHQLFNGCPVCSVLASPAMKACRTPPAWSCATFFWAQTASLCWKRLTPTTPSPRSNGKPPSTG